MDSFEINKIVAAVLLVALLVIGIGKLSNVIFYAHLFRGVKEQNYIFHVMRYALGEK